MNPGHPNVVFALASGRDHAAIAIIRITGKSALKSISPCLGHKDSAPASFALKPRKMTYCKFRDPKTDTVVDDLMAVYFPAPHSYTGEDTIELFCHGGPFIIQEIIRVLLQEGLQLADPGEFTKRAFLNQKLDLTEAEGIRELIEAQSHQQWQAARYLASGKLSETIEALRQQLINAMALLEARIDFPDEGDVTGVGLEKVDAEIERVESLLIKLKGSYTSGRVARQGLTVVFAGAPNAGKSTLLNALLEKQRAIVTPHAGTTRDYIEESLIIEGRLLRIIDTAGIRDTDNVVEKIGVESTMRLAAEADLVIFLAAADQDLQALDQLEKWQSEINSNDKITVVTKSDLAAPDWNKPWLKISCHSGTGLDELRKILVSKVDGAIKDLGTQPFVTSTRHREAIGRACAAIDAFKEARSLGKFDELLAFELQNANRHLASIVGRIDNEHLLDEIFSRFCIGK